MKIIVGNRIVLRPLESKDIDFLYKIENDKRFWEVSSTTQPYSKEILKNYIENAHQSIYDAHQFRFVIEKRSEDIPFGFIDLFNFSAENLSAGVGIIIDPKFQHQGFGSEALNLLKEYCTSDLHLQYLYCSIFEDNTYSLKLFKKCGFEETRLKKDWQIHTQSSKNQIFLHFIF